MDNHTLAPIRQNVLVTMRDTAIAKVRAIEEEALKLPQVPIRTEHTLHAGLYSRTICIPAGVMITGVLVKIQTMLILSGDAMAYTDNGVMRYTGHIVLLGEAGRKQAFTAISDTYLTMIFKTSAKTVEEAESDFTDEVDTLLSRKQEIL